jgi:hypothetical protein
MKGSRERRMRFREQVLTSIDAVSEGRARHRCDVSSPTLDPTVLFDLIVREWGQRLEIGSPPRLRSSTGVLL